MSDDGDTRGEAPEQDQIHDALAQVLTETGVLRDGDLLTGWCLCFETQSAGDSPLAGHVYGPRGMTTWRALGLVTWTAQTGLGPDDDPDD